MALKLTDKIHTVAEGVDTVNKGSAQANAGRAAYTLQDVSNLIGGGGGGIGGSGTINQLALFTASGTIGNALLFATTLGGINFITVGSASAPVSLLVGAASNIIITSQGSAPTSAATVGLAGQMVLYHGDDTDVDNGIYVCVVSGAAGAAKWTKSALTNV